MADDAAQASGSGVYFLLSVTINHMDLKAPPERYWHCSVKMTGAKDYSVVNDLTFAELDRTIVGPWNAGQTFAVSGKLVRTTSSVEAIKITHTQHPKSYYAEQHNESMRASGIADMATNRSLLPLSQGTDVTFELLFSGATKESASPDTAMVEQLCTRLPQAARILAVRSRKGKVPYEIADEYDVQDLLHAVLRAYIKRSVQEDPLPKVAGAKSSRVDVSIEELGVLIEVKYVHGPEDQKRLFD
ncbi:MAG: PD-(D/E)XK nuclease domain-containing protein [Rhodanobacter sp.]